MKKSNINWIGFVGVVLILGAWTAVSWSVIDSDSWLNFITQIIGALFIVCDAYFYRASRSVFMSGATYFLATLILLISLNDFFKFI